jgi:hypothetical protein
MTKKVLLLLAQISHKLPIGYRIQDTGAPRGERNLWLIVDHKGNTVFESFDLMEISKHIDTLPYPTLGVQP